jgi:hypothetical protein
MPWKWATRRSVMRLIGGVFGRLNAGEDWVFLGLTSRGVSGVLRGILENWPLNSKAKSLVYPRVDVIIKRGVLFIQ